MELKWRAFDESGNQKRQKGGYFICDGGYHYWKELIAPYKIQITESRIQKWSSNMKSTWKDVEYIFDIFKKMFLLKKNYRTE